MQRAPYAYVGLAFGHNLDYGINYEQGCSEKKKRHKWGGTGKGQVNSLPRRKAVMQRVHTWTQMAQLTFLKWNSSILHVKWGQNWWHVPTLWHAQRLKWSSNGSLQLRKVLCEELPKEQNYVKYHFIIPTVEAMCNHRNGSRRMQLSSSSNLLQGTKKALQPRWRIAGSSAAQSFHACICRQCCMAF